MGKVSFIASNYCHDGVPQAVLQSAAANSQGSIMMRHFRLILFCLAAVPALAQPVLTVNGLNANYTTTHVFVDEVAGDALPLTILFAPNAVNLTQVEFFSNLNRRDRAALDADGDGVEDGIRPPSGDLVIAGADTHYFKAYAMTNIGGGQYQYVVAASKCGAYRLTARYKVSGNPNWIYYNNFNGQRDHAIVVSPKKAREIVLYELNAINVEAQGIGQSDRSTFVDLWDGPGARSFNATNAKFNLNYLTNLGVNWLWFQPIHPNGIAGRLTDPDTSQPYEVGSPYAVKNFFEVNPLMSKANTRPAALEEFTNFVAAADAAGVSVMLDAAFNHTAHDCELGASGVFYWGGAGNPNNWQATDEIRNRESRVYSQTDAYDMRASSSANAAPAPDRYDFGKWTDVKDVYFGRYAALWANATSTGAHQNEGDWFDSSVGNENSSGGGNGHFDTTTQNTWKYFADYALFWLDRTGYPAGSPANQSYRGIDGLRADFGQGLPPQCWEYLINKVRSRKWDFVFMSESLDGGAVTYRSNRHFDILNENILFDLKSATTATDYRTLFENRRAAYGQGLVLLNTTSHDEENYDDPFQALVRYSVGATIDGAPMVFYGQELGISRTFGFDRYQVNLNKSIAHFMKFNSLQPILWPGNRNFGLDQLQPVYAGINAARQTSRALRSSNRYFINQTSGAAHASIYSVAKYETANGAPNFNDVVFAFANLNRDNNQTGTFNVNINQGGGNLFGIKSNRLYNVRNLAAYLGADALRRSVWLWPGGAWGSNVLANGVFVGMNKVPASDSGWTNAPFEAQYLKLSDVTPPPVPAALSAAAYVIGTNVTFRWNAAVDAEGGISGYHLLVGSSAGAANLLDGILTATNQTVGGTMGQTLTARVAAINAAGVEGPFTAVTAGTVLLEANVDSDGDGMSNGAELIAGTNPLDGNSVLRILSLTTGNLLTWSSVSGLTYQVEFTTNLAASFATLASGLGATQSTAMFYDSQATNGARFYRIKVQPEP